MDNPTKVDLFYERWEPFHLQIVSIAVKYASEEVQANRFEESFQPLCSPSLPPTTPPTTTPTPLLVDSLPPSEPNTTAHSADNHYPTLQELSSLDSDTNSLSIEKEEKYKEKADHPTTTTGYSRVPTRSEEEKIKEEEVAAEKAEELDQGVHRDWLESRKKGCDEWMKFILESVKVDPASLPEKPLRTDLKELSKEIPSTMHVEIIHDLVIFSLSASHISPFLVGLSGGALGFLATSGGAILIGTLFGLAGGGLVGYRAQRRLKGIDEFTFERLPDQDGEVDGDLPRIPSLHATIVSSGFLLTATEYKDMWMPTLSKTIDRRDVYALKVETGALLSAGKDLETYIRDTLLQHGATEIIRHTVLASVCAALLLPASIYKAAVMALDNEYQRTRDICEKAGILLADMIEQKAHGARPLTLIGSGMGSITIVRALLELSKRGGGAAEFQIDQVILICSPLSPDPIEWKTIRRMTSRRVVNVYSKNDWVLAILARLDSLLSARRVVAHVAGLRDLHLPHIRSVDVSDLVHGHLELNSKIPLILDRIDINR